MTKEIKEEICPLCGGKMVPVWTAIGGFPGHPHIHPGPLWGYKCEDCSYKRKVKKETKAGREGCANDHGGDGA